jgi:hypothetical protein
MCTHECKNNPKNVRFNLKLKADRIKFAKILIYFYELSHVIHSYQYSRRTQNLESNHRSMMKYAPKSHDFKRSYGGRVDLAIAQKNDGLVAALTRTMTTAGVDVSDLVAHDLGYVSQRRLKRKKMETYKKNRAAWDAGLTAIHAVAHTWTYKDDNGLTARQIKLIEKQAIVAEQPKDVKEASEEPKKKKQRISNDHSDKCAGGQCETSHPTKLYKRRKIHNECMHGLCKTCCAARTGKKVCNAKK